MSSDKNNIIKHGGYMYKIKKIDISSVALYSFIMILIIGFAFMIPLGLVSLIISSFGPSSQMDNPGFSGFFSGIFLIIFPLLYAIFGTIVNVLISLLYNALSSKLGGIKIELDKVDYQSNLHIDASR